MDCPHCGINIHPVVQDQSVNWNGQYTNIDVKSGHCPACERFFASGRIGNLPFEYFIPRVPGTRAAPKEVPSPIAKDFEEAATVLYLSAKASAALSRRCLQNVLTAHGYAGRDLMKQVSAFISENDPAKVAPQSLRETVDAVRNFGNFSAHPIDDQTSLQIIEVEPHEAEWCLDILSEMFEHFYVRPAEAAAKKAALNAKLGAAGKPAAQ